ncbi:MAG: hypothetical protein ACR2I2_13505 [Bryobacteraceae bacterium]
MPTPEQIIRIDAKTFQDSLGELAATMVQKVFREGRQHIAGPLYVGEDIAMLIRYGASVYNLLNYLNADERRKEDCYWYVRYGVTGMSLVRSLIDCLYNVVAILEDPAEKAPQYRKSGLKKTLDDIDEDLKQYADQQDRQESLQQRRKTVELLVQGSGFTIDEVMQLKKHEMWPTFGTYVNTMQPGGVRTEIQEFLKTFAHLEWRQYSALSHGAYEAFIGTLGMVPVGAYYMNDFLPHEVRDKLDETYDLFLSMHIGRSATVLLCMLTEIQVHCGFDGANINERICKVWAALLPVPETKELYDGRYSELMKNRGIEKARELTVLSISRAPNPVVEPK